MRPKRPPLNPLTAVVCLTLTLLGACSSGGSGGSGSGNGTGGGSGAPDACTETARKQFTLDVARQWYLFPELLPTAVNLAEFEDAEQLLEHLTATAREQGKDRHFSYLTTRAEEQALLGDGRFIAATRSWPWTQAAASPRPATCSPTAARSARHSGRSKPACVVA